MGLFLIDEHCGSSDMVDDNERITILYRWRTTGRKWYRYLVEARDEEIKKITYGGTKRRRRLESKKIMTPNDLLVKEELEDCQYVNNLPAPWHEPMGQKIWRQYNELYFFQGYITQNVLYIDEYRFGYAVGRRFWKAKLLKKYLGLSIGKLEEIDWFSQDVSEYTQPGKERGLVIVGRTIARTKKIWLLPEGGRT